MTKLLVPRSLNMACIKWWSKNRQEFVSKVWSKKNHFLVAKFLLLNPAWKFDNFFQSCQIWHFRQTWLGFIFPDLLLLDFWHNPHAKSWMQKIFEQKQTRCCLPSGSWEGWIRKGTNREPGDSTPGAGGLAEKAARHFNPWDDEIKRCGLKITQTYCERKQTKEHTAR